MPANVSRMPASSSTTRMLCMLRNHRCRGGFGNDRQFDDEAGTDRIVFFHANGAMMIFHDAANDRQDQSRAALLGREIRKEEFPFQFAGDAMSGISDRNLNRGAAGNERGRNTNLAHD